MPTNRERSKVAARLRELAKDYEKVPIWSVIAACALPEPIDDVMMACGLWRAVHATEICGRLADLIEPEERTCRMTVLENARGNPKYFLMYVCSECHGAVVHDKYDPIYYCPNCGARVVSE